jgi:hypothetical protein
LDECRRLCGVANIGDVDLDAVANAFDVIKVSAVIRDQAVHDGDVGAEFHEAMRQFDPIKPRPPVIRTRAPSNLFSRAAPIVARLTTLSTSASVING